MLGDVPITRTSQAPVSPSRMTRPVAEISVVIPMFNEAEVLPLALDEAVRALDQVAERWELLVVDDGSRDETPAILLRWAAREPRIRPLLQPENRGYSQALARGFAEARNDLVFFTDGDAQFDLREIAALAEHLAPDVDLVVGWRKRRQDPPLRLLTSALYNRLQATVFGVRVRDVNCAFKLMRRSFVAGLPFVSQGFLINAELFARARAAGAKWREVPVTHRPRAGGSSTVRFGSVLRTLRDLWALRRALRSS